MSKRLIAGGYAYTFSIWTTAEAEDQARISPGVQQELGDLARKVIEFAVARGFDGRGGESFVVGEQGLVSESSPLFGMRIRRASDQTHRGPTPWMHGYVLVLERRATVRWEPLAYLLIDEPRSLAEDRFKSAIDKQAMKKLRADLHSLGVTSTYKVDDDPTLSVGIGLVVRSSHGFYRWQEGSVTRRHLNTDPIGCAIRVARRYTELQAEDTEIPLRRTAAGRISHIASYLAAEPEADEIWRRDLLEIATGGSRTQLLRYSAGLLWAGLESRSAWVGRRLAHPARCLLMWLLRSQKRTWFLISGLMLWGGLETIWDTGLGAAILVVMTSGLALHPLVEWARKRLKIEPKAPDRAAE
ncbi:hypothetical protein [Nonomuraea endophytica]|uniref:Uncharacterized protein n=1 Tax=Nonomuraea endophytica TaxID=714136 RepID=A0A7W8EJ78_9ACTN|nr:hypothetical protein [Nonomuraea endophytica]MBB5081354.1 hypothetical protein [Nonomuraea endophytica]